MKELVLIFLFGVAAIILAYAGYRAGLLSLTVKSAAMFYGGIYPSSCLSRAKLTRAEGKIQRVLFLEENRTYSFALNCENITRGSVSAVLLDRSGNCMISVDSETPFASFTANTGKSYTLKIEFKNADGEYNLAWS